MGGICWRLPVPLAQILAQIMRCKATPPPATSPTLTAGQVAMQHSPYQPIWPHRYESAAVGTIGVLGIIDSAIVLEVYVQCRHSGVCTACWHVARTNQLEKRHREKEIPYFAAIQHRCKPVFPSPARTAQNYTMPPKHADPAFEAAWSTRILDINVQTRPKIGTERRKISSWFYPRAFWRPPFSI
ncbi:hypothetical protein K456DRAFT_1939816 [Colletotrichum gloeosporioides 23]|nr:hypothetical protein K456DRAFT_1939816 [Colletotrichum gloeosporioides 23]